MKRIIFSILLVLFVVGCSSNTDSNANQESEKEANTNSTSEEEKIVLKFASPHAPSNPFAKVANDPFMERVVELTDGRVEFDYYPGEQLGKAADLLQLTKDGVTDIAYFANAYFSSEMPIGSALIGMPGLYETSYQGTMAYLNVSQQSPMLETDFLRHGVRPIFAWVTPTYDLFSNGKEIRVPDDLSGLRVRTAGGALSEAIQFAGASAVQLSEVEVYEGFERGVIDAIHMNGITFDSYDMGELASHATHGLNFAGAGVGFIINEDVFQGLPEDIQEALLQAGREVAESSSKQYDPDNQKAFEKLLNEDGVNVYELTDDEKEQWADLFEEFNEMWLEKQDSEEFNEAYELFKQEVEKLKSE